MPPATPSPASGPALITARRLAALLRISARAVRKGMAGKPPSRRDVQCGRPAAQWTFLDLRDEWRADLHALARERGLRDVSELFDPAPPSAPAVPPPPAPAPARVDAKWLRLHEPLVDIAIAGLENRATPTEDDVAWLFHKTFQHFEQLLADHARAPVKVRRRIKASLIDFLHAHFKAGWPARAALQRLFERKLQRWIAGGRQCEALDSGRRMSSGNFRRPDFSADEREIAKLAVQLDGNETSARRLLEDQGKLSPEFVDYYPLDQRRDKSALPKSVRRAITPLVTAAVYERRGPKAVRDAGSYITRDWSGVRPGNWFVFDDVKWNHPFAFRLQDGSTDITCGECLVGTDEVSDYPLGFLLIAGHYNGLHVRRAIAQILNDVGLPHDGLTLELSVWKSRFVVGDNLAGWSPLHWRDFENGLNDPRLRIKIHHARIHRAKTIESFFGRLQERMRCLPGFVGFNERTEKMERMQALIARARRGDAEALAQFPTQEQLRDAIRAVMEEFRHQPGNGDRLRGRTPAEAWNEAILARPLRQLEPDARHLLSTHGKIATLHPTRGILLSLPGHKQQVCYVDKHYTGLLVERGETKVRVRIDLEHPEVISCSDMKETIRFSAIAQMAPAHGAPREHLATLARLRSAHRAPAKALFGEIQHDVQSNIVREGEQDDATLEEGRFHQAAVAAYVDTQREDRSEAARLRRRAERLGFSVEGHDLANARQRDALRMELDAEEMARGQSAGVGEKT